MHPPSEQTESKPEYLTPLQAFYGRPSQAGFGSAVFFAYLAADADLVEAALGKYRFFMGPLWDRFGEAAWLEPWQVIYRRPSENHPGIVSELETIPDPTQSAAMLLETVSDVAAAQQALQNTFDDPAVTELIICQIGDGAAMSGLLLAGRRKRDATPDTEATFLVFLLD